MREVVVVEFCDVHWELGEGEKVEASTNRTLLVDGRTLDLALCGACVTDVDRTIWLFRSYGTIDGERPKGRPMKTTTCSICDHTSPNRSALQAHYRRAHGVSIKEGEAQ